MGSTCINYYICVNNSKISATDNMFTYMIAEHKYLLVLEVVQEVGCTGGG